MSFSDGHWHAADKTGSAGKTIQGQDSSEMRLEDLSRQIAQLRKGIAANATELQTRSHLRVSKTTLCKELCSMSLWTIFTSLQIEYACCLQSACQDDGTIKLQQMDRYKQHVAYAT